MAPTKIIYKKNQITPTIKNTRIKTIQKARLITSKKILLTPLNSSPSTDIINIIYMYDKIKNKLAKPNSNGANTRLVYARIF